MIRAVFAFLRHAVALLALWLFCGGLALGFYHSVNGLQLEAGPLLATCYLVWLIASLACTALYFAGCQSKGGAS